MSVDYSYVKDLLHKLTLPNCPKLPIIKLLEKEVIGTLDEDTLDELGEDKTKWIAWGIGEGYFNTAETKKLMLEMVGSNSKLFDPTRD